MTSVRTRRAWRELSRHRLRAVLTVATLAAAVLGVWLFAIPRQMDALMTDRIDEDAIHDARLFPDGIPVDDATVARLRAVAGVAALDVRSNFFTEVRIGDRFHDVWLVGVRDFDDQQVNVVGVEDGSVPRADAPSLEALADHQNERSGRPTGGIGDEVLIRSGRGSLEPVHITGIGGTVFESHGATEGAPVLYLPIETVWKLWPWDQVAGTVELRVTDRARAPTAAAIDGVRAEIAEIRPQVQYRGLVEIRPAGQWPGEDDFDNFVVLFWLIVAVSMLSSLVLVATTATTLVREQTQEIGIMKAIGATRRQIVTGFAAMLGLLGVAGTLVGTALGYPLTNLLIDVMNREFLGVENDWRFSWYALALSGLVGVGGTLLAALPALRRVARATVRDAIGSAGIGTDFGGRRADRTLRGLTPLPGALRLGLRNAARRKGRTATTTVQVALAVGTLLGFTSLVLTLLEVSEQSRLSEGGDIEVYSSASGRRLDAAAIDLVDDIDGIDRVQPLASMPVLVGDTETFVWGLPADPVYRYELARGRWFADDEERAPIAVAGPAMANVHGLEIGELVTVQTPGASLTWEIVGIDTTMVGDGLALFAPLGTVLDAIGQPEPSAMWLTTESTESTVVDRVGADVRETLERRGYGVSVDLRYLEREAERATDRTIVTIIMTMGLPVVAIGMIGLASAIATSALERRREIGVLRSIGASRRQIRRVFRAEAAAIVIAGWLAGIAVGYLVGRIILLAMNEAFDVEFTLLYPLWPIPVSFAIAFVVAAVVLARPIGHAARMPPGESLRYE